MHFDGLLQPLVRTFRLCYAGGETYVVILHPNILSVWTPTCNPHVKASYKSSLYITADWGTSILHEALGLVSFLQRDLQLFSDFPCFF